MPLYDWNASYSVKVKRCDDDHKKLFALINDLYEAMQTGKGAEVVQKVAEELEEYTKFHFSAEEALMAGTKYPALAKHRIEHQDFIHSIARFRREGIANQSIAVLAFMNDWLVNHIKRSDQRYSAHLNAHGIS